MRVHQRLLAAIVALCAVLGVGACPALLTADIVHYGNFAGTNVQFLGVQESSSAIGNGAGQFSELYGSPSVLGNKLVFSPSLFEALSQGAQNSMVNGQLSFNLQASPGYQIAGILISEIGDYTLSTPFPGGAAFAGDAMSGFVQNQNGMYTNSSSFTQMQLNSDGPGVFGAIWNNNLHLAFTPVSSLVFDLDNTLNAASLAGSAAIIRKTGVTVEVLLVAIPEPGAALGMMSLVGLVGLIRIRRRATA